jgi:nucleotide-binding universal stress UspA family protein
MYHHILIAIDGSEASTRAAEHGLNLARAVGAKVSLLTVTEPFHVFSFEARQLEDTRPQYQEHMAALAEQILAAPVREAETAGIAFEKIRREGDAPHEIILEVAEAKRCDLIVMGSHGRRGISAVMLGSVTMKVLAHARRPVLVVR